MEALMNGYTDFSGIYQAVAVEALKELYKMTEAQVTEAKPKARPRLLTYWKQAALFGVVGVVIAIPIVIRLLV
jgi:hypothetical protein